MQHKLFNNHRVGWEVEERQSIDTQLKLELLKLMLSMHVIMPRSKVVTYYIDQDANSLQFIYSIK